MSIDKAPMLVEEMPAIAQTMQILANVIDDHEAKLNALLSKLEVLYYLLLCLLIAHLLGMIKTAAQVVP